MNRNIIGLVICLTKVFLLSELSGQEPAGREELAKSARGLIPFFAEIPPDGLKDHFTSGFLRAIPESRMMKIIKDIHQSHGAAKSVIVTKIAGPFNGVVEYQFAQGKRMRTMLILDGKPPHKIIGIRFVGGIQGEDSFERIQAELKKLSGRVGCSVQRIGGKDETVWELNGVEPLAVASSFKLVVFAALVKEIEAGERKWSDVVKLQDRWKSLPGGQLQDWPAGSPLTLQTLSSLMISKSDNTAADHLIHILGREYVEQVSNLFALESDQNGPKKRQYNRPFLTTGEMFKIKLVLSDSLQSSYAEADVESRREFLNTIVSQASLQNHRVLHSPHMNSTVEWFYSPRAMCKIMGWFHSPNRDPLARTILGINRGFSLDRDLWLYVGFKGGSEPGVLSYVFLLKSKKQNWYSIAMIWNDHKNEVEDGKLMSLGQRLINVLNQSESE